MNERIEYVVVDKYGLRYAVGPDADRAITLASAWDKRWSDVAPHRVVKRTFIEEQVWP